MSDLLSELGRLTESDEESDSAWEAKLAEINGRAPAEPDTPAEPEEAPAEAETATEGQPRDEHGRFAPRVQPEVDEHPREAELEAEEQTATQPETAQPDDIESYLAKYGGNVHEALKAAAEAQKTIGRQGSEVGELRARLEQLEQARQEQPQQPQAPRQITEQDIERLDGLAMTEGGGFRAMQEAAQLDPSGVLAQRVFETWATVAPGQATAFLADQIAEAKLAEFREELAPIQAKGKEAEEQAAFVETWGKLSQAHPEVEQLVPTMSQILDENEPLARAIYSADGETQLALLGTLADAAKARQNPVVSEAIAQFEAERGEASVAAKKAATLVAPSGQVGSPPGGGQQAEKTPAQLEAERIKAGLMQAPETSISSGWTTE